tara:strand:- start:1309 stop:2595 length:1287 start_codon:yes stop_codon:yes gene_type:complete
MIRKILIFLLINLFVFSNSYSFDFNNVYNLKTFSSAKLEMNDTNLVDQENAENLVKNIENLDAILIKKSKEITKKNRSRKKEKYKGAEAIFADYENSVVYIGNRKNGNWVGSGSGFVVDHNGLKIITNWHVIEDADHIGVWLKPKKLVDDKFLIENEDYYEAELINVSKKRDLAILKVANLPLKIKPLKYGKFKNVKIGETLFAIGHPGGLLWTFNSGMVSQIRPNYKWNYRNSRHVANVIQIQVPINPGNSGGPLFNKKKELVGVNTFTAEGENLNFAIAVDDVVNFLKEKPKKIKKTKNNKWIKKKDKGSTWIKKKDKKKKTDGSIDLSNAKEVDINNNGKIDAWLIDENNNGIYEIAYGDTNENGIIDIIVVDKNENKIYEFTFIDSDEDGNPNIGEYDENEDGNIDVIAYDYDQDGKWDKFENT